MSNRDDAFEAFALELIERLSNHPDVPAITRSIDGSTLSIGSFQANLPSLYRTYSLQSPELQAFQLESLVSFLVRGGDNDNDNETFEDVRAHLRPKIWSRATISFDRFDMPFCLVGEHLILSIVYDMPQAIQSVPWARFNKWGVAFNDALRVAYENLDAGSCFMGSQAEGMPGHCSDATYDNYGSARFLTERPYGLYGIDYPRWAFPAARDACAMCQADEPSHIEFNVELCLEMAEKDPKPLPPFPLVDYGDGWVNWHPEPGSEVATMLAPRQLDFLLNVYGEQTHHLQSTADERNDFVLIESLVPDQGGNAGQVPKTTTKWWTNTECLLPTADYVIFPDDQGYKFAWDDVMKVCGEHLAPAEALYPPRWRTIGTPTAAEFEELQRLALE